IDLPHNERAINQICSLERSVQRSGRDQITHPTHGRDDIANAIAGAVDRARSASTYRLDVFSPDFQDIDAKPPAKPPVPEANQRAFDYVAAVCAANGLLIP